MTIDSRPFSESQKGMRWEDPATYPPEFQSLASPAMIVDLDIVTCNIDRMLRIAQSPHRLRPHCKTHKTRAIIDLELQRGITRHKCATLAEAEMLAAAGATDILIAYQCVGPNVQRLGELIDTFPGVRFMCLVDHPAALDAIASEMERRGKEIGALIDLDSGMGRTGIEIGESAMELYEAASTTPGIRVEGLHWYDGQIRQTDLVERRAECLAGWERLTAFRDRLMSQGFQVPRIVAAGTGGFPILAEQEEPGLELSPGTVVFYDHGYRTIFPDLPFRPAVGILTRVISCNRPGFLTLDVGHKACAADPPAGQRLFFPALPDAREVQHSEEHLVLQTDSAAPFGLGDPLLAIPFHVCPTSAAYDEAQVVSGGRCVGRWPITARNRKITI